MDCVTTGFAGKQKWILKKIRDSRKIYNIVIIPYSHKWEECDYFDIKQDKKKNYK
jgi:hypothetical protein